MMDRLGGYITNGKEWLYNRWIEFTITDEISYRVVLYGEGMRLYNGWD